MLFRKHGRHFIKAYPIRGPDYVSNTVIPVRDGMLVHILPPGPGGRGQPGLPPRAVREPGMGEYSSKCAKRRNHILRILG